MKKCRHFFQWILLLSIAFTLTFLFPALSMAQNQLALDYDITTAVIAALGRDDMVPANLIRVKTVDGVVTLAGMVETILAHDRAAELAMTVAGVRNVVNNIVVIPLARADEEIQRDVAQALQINPAITPEHVQVIVQNGMVILEGDVDSQAEKQIVEAVIADVRGVRAINNLITVTPRAIVPDAEIENEITERLRLDVMVDSSFIDVKVNEGYVELVGMVGTAAEKKRAYQDAWVSGVRSVDVSNLSVDYATMLQKRRKPDVSVAPSDDDIAHAVAAALTYNLRLPPNDVSVEVHNGVVTLSGTVDSLRTRQAAEQEALNVLGVTQVNNNIEVKREKPLSDEEVQNNIGVNF